MSLRKAMKQQENEWIKTTVITHLSKDEKSEESSEVKNWSFSYKHDRPPLHVRMILTNDERKESIIVQRNYFGPTFITIKFEDDIPDSLNSAIQKFCKEKNRLWALTLTSKSITHVSSIDETTYNDAYFHILENYYSDILKKIESFSQNFDELRDFIRLPKRNIEKLKKLESIPLDASLKYHVHEMKEPLNEIKEEKDDSNDTELNAMYRTITKIESEISDFKIDLEVAEYEINRIDPTQRTLPHNIERINKLTTEIDRLKILISEKQRELEKNNGYKNYHVKKVLEMESNGKWNKKFNTATMDSSNKSNRQLHKLLISQGWFKVNPELRSKSLKIAGEEDRAEYREFVRNVVRSR